MSDTSPLAKNLGWFVAGALLTTLVFYSMVMPRVNQSSQATRMEEGKLITAATEMRMVKADLQQVTQDRDACTAKFARSTILYDQGLFSSEARAWVIPVDVEPLLGPNKVGTYSHYDPKTQTETVHFKGKTQ